MTPRLLVDGLREPGQEIILDEAQAHHALRVLRLRAGNVAHLIAEYSRKPGATPARSSLRMHSQPAHRPHSG